MQREKTSPSKPKSGSYRHGDLRRAVLEGAFEIVQEKGPDGLSLREVARKAGVSPAAPYRHFASKEALLAELALGGFQRLNSYLMKGVDPNQPPTRELMNNMGRHYRAFARENPDHYRLMFTDVVKEHQEYPELNQAGGAAFGALVKMIEGLQQQGIFREGNSDVFAGFVWSYVHGFVMLEIESRITQSHESFRCNAPDSDSEYEQHLDLVFEALMKR